MKRQRPEIAERSEKRDSAKKPGDTIDYAWRLFKSGKIDDALKEFAAVLQSNLPPRMKESALLGTGRCYQAQGRYDDALNIFQQNRNVQFTQAEARCLIELGQGNKALAVLDRFPKDKNCLLAKARCYQQLNCYREARDVYDQLLRLAPNDEDVVLSYAIFLEEDEKEFTRALDILEGYLRRYPGNNKFQLARARCLIELERGNEALAVLERFSEDRNCLLAKARCYQKLGRHREAGEVYDQLRSLAPNDKDVLLSYARYLQEAGMQNRASSEYDALLKLYPRDLTIKLSYACFLEECGQFKKALSVAGHNSDKRFLLRKTSILIKMGKHDEAVKIYQDILERNPDDKSTHYAYAICLMEMMQYDQAITILNKYPGEKDFILKISICLSKMGKPDNALSIIDQIDIDKDSLLAKAYILTKARRFAEAQEIYDTLFRLYPEDEILSSYIIFLQKTECYDEAFQLFQSRTSQRLRFNLEELLFYSRAYNRESINLALRKIWMLVKQYPSTPKTLLTIIISLAQLRNCIDQHAIAAILRQLGMRNRQYDIELLDELIYRYPYVPRFYLLRVDLYCETERSQLLIQYYEEIILRFPYCKEAYRAYLRFLRERDLDYAALEKRIKSKFPYFNREFASRGAVAVTRISYKVVPPKIEARGQEVIGRRHFLRREYREAAGAFAYAADDCRAKGKKQEQANAHYMVATCLRLARHNSASGAAYNDAGELYRELEMSDYAVTAYFCAGFMRLLAGETTSATYCICRVSDLLSSDDNNYAELENAVQLAAKAITGQASPLTHFPAAASCAQRAGDAFNQNGRKREAAVCYQLTGYFYELYKENQEGAALLYNKAGNLYEEVPDYPQAIHCYRAAARIRSQLKQIGNFNKHNKSEKFCSTRARILSEKIVTVDYLEPYGIFSCSRPCDRAITQAPQQFWQSHADAYTTYEDEMLEYFVDTIKTRMGCDELPFELDSEQNLRDSLISLCQRHNDPVNLAGILLIRDEKEEDIFPHYLLFFNRLVDIYVSACHISTRHEIVFLCDDSTERQLNNIFAQIKEQPSNKIQPRTLICCAVLNKLDKYCLQVESIEGSIEGAGRIPVANHFILTARHIDSNLRAQATLLLENEPVGSTIIVKINTGAHWQLWFITKNAEGEVKPYIFNPVHTGGWSSGHDCLLLQYQYLYFQDFNIYQNIARAINWRNEYYKELERECVCKLDEKDRLQVQHEGRLPDFAAGPVAYFFARETFYNLLEYLYIKYHGYNALMQFKELTLRTSRLQ